MENTTTQNPLETRVYEILETFGVEPEAMRRDATFADLDVDSLDLVELAQIIEDEYGVALTVEDAAKIGTVGEAIDLIASRMS